MVQAHSKSLQLAPIESQDTPAPSGQVSEAHGGQQLSSPEADFNLEDLASRFLEHLSRVRRCSPCTIEAYQADCRKFTAQLTAAGHNLDVRTISANHIERCVGQLGHLSPASARRFLYALRSFFEYLRRLEIVRHNPAQDVPLPQREQTLPKFFTTAQVEQLTAACHDIREATITALLRCCGVRRAELLSLNIEDISADFSSLKVKGKNRKERLLPVHSELKGLLRDYVASLPDEGQRALIRNTIGNRMSATSFYRLFHRLMERADLSDTDLTPHSLRHYFGSELAKAGVDVVTIAELMGHSNISVTSIYLHSDLAAKRSAIAHLPPMGVQSTEDEQKQTTHG